MVSEFGKNMKDIIRQILKSIGIYTTVHKLRIGYREQQIVKEWANKGRPVPPPSVYKYNEIKRYAKHYKPSVFIETGTYYGGSIVAVNHLFKKIYSIELSKELFLLAVDKFKHNKKIFIIHGDSALELPKILNDIHEPVLFWLDGHYSGGETALGDKETPIMEELQIIFSRNNSKDVILIDDAREFTGVKGYPEILELEKFVKTQNCNRYFIVKDDIIRITSVKPI